MYYAGRYPVQTRRGSPQPKYLSSAVSASDYYYRGLSDLFRGLSVGRRGDFTCRLWTWLRGTSVLSQGTVTELLSFSLRIINHDSNKHGFRSISYSNRPFCRRCGGCCRPRLPPPRARSRVSYRRRRSCRGTLCCAVSTRSDNVTPVPRAPEWMSIRWSLAFQADCAFSTAFSWALCSRLYSQLVKRRSGGVFSRQ